MNLLVVDKDLGVRRSLEMIASTDGWNTFSCDQFADVVRTIRSNVIDVLVCGYCMPPITGLDIVRRARAASLHIPVVMISANPDNIDRCVAKTLGIYKILLKPPDVDEVRRALVDAARDRRSTARDR
jgi:DNA-binding NtrC family response regulator